MPATDNKPPRPQRYGLMALFGVVLLAAVVWLKVGNHRSGPRGEPPRTNVPANAPTPSTANKPASVPVPPGTVITSEEVLGKLDGWLAKNENYHAQVESALPSGTVMGRMDVFAFTDGTNGQIVRLKAEMFLPQAVQYQAQKQNGKLEIYFPKSDQLVESDAAKMLASMPSVPVLAANQTGLSSLLKLARSSFAEASADLRVVTLVLNMQTMNMPGASGDLYLSLRTDDQGKLLGLEERAMGQRLITTLKYLSFDRDLIIRDAPVIPPGRVAVTNKTLQAAMQEEILRNMNKPIGTKI